MTVLAVAIVIHVLSVVWWIGGLAFVTAVILPALRSGRAGDARTIFELIESRFAPQARVAVVLVGLSGLYMLFRLDLWSSFAQLRFWWLDAMVLFWLLFFLLLFIIEPAGLLERLARRGGDQRRWVRMQRMHLVVLLLALAIIAGAVAGSHGF
ncbi:MAG TPA: hypothetical protein VFX20_13275 [Steroidobacteraceae bacterium]|nr:hypothetical protein [Steroidobacteraceae bacterium]